MSFESLTNEINEDYTFFWDAVIDEHLHGLDSGSASGYWKRMNTVDIHGVRAVPSMGSNKRTYREAISCGS